MMPAAITSGAPSHVVAGGDKMAAHGGAHDAEANETELKGLRHDVFLNVERRATEGHWPRNQLASERQPRPASVVVAGLYSQPIHPV